MKKKRIISLILATTMAATVVVSGCGKSGDSEKTDDGKKKTEASDDKVLEFYMDIIRMQANGHLHRLCAISMTSLQKSMQMEKWNLKQFRQRISTVW